MFLRFLIVFIVAFAAVESAQAQKRIALLIGNEDYAREVGKLKNPVNDVNLIAASLRRIGFADADIQIIKNADRIALLAAVDGYAAKLASAGDNAVGFFYYSGHGAANKLDRRNYLIPVGVQRLTGLLPRVERHTLSGLDALNAWRTTTNRIDAARRLSVRTAAA